MRFARLAVVIGALACWCSTAPAQLTVVSTQPSLNANNVPRGSSIVVNFNKPVNPATFTPGNFGAFAKWSGPVGGSLTFSNGNTRATLTPAREFLAGEMVMLMMSHDLKAADGSALRQAGYTLTFTTAAPSRGGMFRHLQTMSDRDTTGAQTRIYGGLACDLDLDGWPDLTLVNEVSADLRVFLNRADGSGLFGTMLPTYTPIPEESSPNEPADFNGDGFVDIVTSSIDDIAIAMGNGDGTFDSPTLITIGGFTRGIGVLDADGDGDLDITVTSRFANSIALLLNNGVGVFSAPSFFGSVDNGPYGMTAADMNNDGILDLVVGYVQSQTIGVFRGNGNGTFTHVSSRSAGGSNWVVYCADLNNDGKLDVSSANSGSGNASVLLGNGDGTLQPAAVEDIGGHVTATDLADVDGDGDIDWIVSCFGCSRWDVFRNNGAGVMTFERSFDAPANPACCLPADFDNDGDVDLALLDEIADVIVLMENTCPADFNNDGFATGDDFDQYVAAFEAGDDAADFNQDGFVTGDDFDAFVAAFEIGC